MKTNRNKKNANANKYNYTAYKSGKETIIVWNDLAQMMMGNGLPPMGVRVIKDKGDKRK